MLKSPAEKFLKDYKKKTDPLLERYFQQQIKEAKALGKTPTELLKRLFQLTQRGKKFRGALMILGYQIAGGSKKEEILKTSIFIELFHAGLLIHDDVMDRDSLRRGLPTLHKQFEELGKTVEIKSSANHFGESMAICAGDIAFFLAWNKLLNCNFSSKRLLETAKIFARYSTRITHGQVLDITNLPQQTDNHKNILKFFQLKTAEYTGLLPLLIGSTLAGLKNQSKINALKEYGLSLGWAFQIQDDLLGMFGDREIIGKPVGSDLREGKQTLLMFHLAREGNKEQRAFQKHVLGNKNITRKDVLKMRRILKESNSYKYVHDLGLRYVEKGKIQISNITNNNKFRILLESFIVLMMKRVK